MEKIEIINEILQILAKESEISLKNDMSIEEKITLLNVLILARPAGNLESYLNDLYNKFLNMTKNEVKINSENLKYKHNKIYLNENMFDIKVDICLVFSEYLMDNMFQTYNSIDNMLILRNGLKTREDLYQLFKDNSNKINYKKIYPIKSENLHFDFVAKLIVPKVNILNSDDFKSLEFALVDFVDFVKENQLKSVCVNLKNLPNSLNEEKVINKIEKFTIKLFTKNKLKIKTIFLKNC